MTTHKEALTLARQLLWRYRHETPIGNQPHMIYQEVDEAFERIDEALAQPEQSTTCGEPVAWRNAAIRVGEDLCSVGPFGYYDMTAEQWLDWALSVVTVHAPPPQRPSRSDIKPLTDKEIDSFREANSEGRGAGWRFNFKGFARAIEAAHGIKEQQ